MLFSLCFAFSCTGGGSGPAPVSLGKTGAIEWEAPRTSTDVRLNAIALPGLRRGYAVGDEGVILATRDGGLTWRPQSSPRRKDLLGVAFPAPLRGYAVGEGGTILATPDGGRTWTVQSSPVSSDLLSVSFPAPETGYAAGTGGTVLGTSDGGRTWRKRPVSPALGHPYDLILSRIEFLDTRHGYVLSRHTHLLLATSDGGLTFEARMTGSTQPRGLSFIDRKRGFLAGEEGDVLSTKDAGLTWSALRCCRETESLYDVSFTTPSRGLAAGTVLERKTASERQKAILLSTQDGGRNWEELHPGGGEVLTDATWGGGKAAAVGSSGTLVIGRRAGQSREPLG